MRSKGYWMKISYRNDNLSDDFICSFCRRHVYLEFLCDKCDYRFCPYCGCRMNKKETA